MKIAAAHWAAGILGESDILGALLNANKTVLQQPNFEGKTPLHLAVSTTYYTKTNLVKTLKVLFDNNVDPNLPDIAGKLPLHEAVELNILKAKKHSRLSSTTLKILMPQTMTKILPCT